MKLPRLIAITGERRAWALAAVILVQGLCALFFAADVAFDFTERGASGSAHLALEAVAAAALAAGTLFLMAELRRLLTRQEALRRGVMAARGEMAEVIDGFFDRWRLTPAERDVALMALKGLDNDAIAEVRGAAAGTVRAQCARVYAKAGVDSRAQLMSVFIEELLAEPLSRERGKA
ncbi:helix-turn-helix transcriptional regulator [Rubrimonas cliftonensis]|uniref:Regulatory protein, luxR family n=1 Tax=Rubrimonas cliftonensis TaxID=89524 RepID=A0A1H3VLW8_9RHOB|nr:helix-turn-helix transcriptional regulator [Rubrimonas cliftonensis]SDZ75775.1 regulatory protein, luxR family [Rubrimonas cliftonensis]